MLKELRAIVLKAVACFVAIIVLTFALIFWAGSDRTQRWMASSRSITPAPTVSCPRAKAAAFVKEAQRAGVVHRIDTGRSVPRIYVRPAWDELTIDDKRIFDQALQCWLSPDGKSRVIAVYHDYRTGKEVADSNQHGFQIH